MLPLKHTVITCIAVDDVKESFTGEITCPQKKELIKLEQLNVTSFSLY